MSSARQRPLAILRPVIRPAVAAGLGLTLAVGAPLLAGCGTGQVAQTARQVSAVDGAQGDVGQIAVRNAMLVYPQGGEHFYRRGEDAPLTVVIVNSGVPEDELTSVRSPAAEAVQVEGQRSLQPLHTLRAVAPSKDADQSGGSELTQGQITIVLVNLVEDVKPGKPVPVTFLFRQAGELTLDVPIGPPPDESGAETTS